MLNDRSMGMRLWTHVLPAVFSAALVATARNASAAPPTLVSPERVEDANLAIRSNGDIFVVGEIEPAVVVFRSTDGGASFTEWSRFDQTEPLTGLVTFDSPSIHVASGSHERIFVSAVRRDPSTDIDDLQVHFADPASNSPTWTTRTLATATGSNGLYYTSIQSDAEDYDSYNVYVAFMSDPPSGSQWVSFSRSVNFGLAWSTPYTVVPATGFVRSVSLEWGDDDRLHLAAAEIHGTETDIIYRQAGERAQSLASWSDLQQITRVGNSQSASDPQIAAAGASGRVLMTYRRGGSTELRVSSDHGVTWNAETDAQEFPYSSGGVAAGSSGFAISAYDDQAVMLSRPLDTDPSGPWYDVELHDLPDTPERSSRLAFDATRGSWGILAGHHDGLSFLGEWFLDLTAQPELPLADARLGHAEPNPFRTNVRFVAGDAGGAATLRVFAPNGRLVHRWTDPTTRSNDVSVHEWNGRDLDGRPVAAGAYFYRVDRPGQTVTGHIVRMR